MEHFLNTFIGLFVIVDPFAVLPYYISISERFSPAERLQTRRKAGIVALVILMTFGLTGLSIFRVFGISLPAFQIAGGILLSMLGIAQLNAKRTRVRESEIEETKTKDDVSVFPIATPMIAGPGAISTVVLYATEAHTIMTKISLGIAIFLVIISVYLILKAAPLLFKVLGYTGLNVVTRLMGIILTSVGVQFIINGLKTVSTEFRVPGM